MSQNPNAPSWWLGQNLVGGYLVWSDNDTPVHKPVHWFAPRPVPDDERHNQYWPICPAGEAVAPTMAHCSPTDCTASCGACADLVAEHTRCYRFLDRGVARYCGLRLVQGEKNV